MPDAAVVLYRRLVLVALCAGGLFASVVACLLTMGAPRHLLATVSDACMSLSHISSEAISVLLVSVLLATLLAGSISLLVTLHKTRRFISALTRMRGVSARPGALSACSRVRARCVVVRDERMLAFSHGLLRPRIYLSTAVVDALDDEALAAVLAHEDHHVARRDPAKLFSARVAARALFWLPVVNELRGRYELAAEVSADRWSTHRLGSNKPLVRALLQFADAAPGMAVAHMAGGNLTAERIRLLVSSECAPRSVSRRAAWLSMLATGAIVVLTLVHLSLPGM